MLINDVWISINKDLKNYVSTVLYCSAMFSQNLNRTNLNNCQIRVFKFPFFFQTCWKSHVWPSSSQLREITTSFTSCSLKLAHSITVSSTGFYPKHPGSTTMSAAPYLFGYNTDYSLSTAAWKSRFKNLKIKTARVLNLNRHDWIVLLQSNYIYI